MVQTMDGHPDPFNPDELVAADEQEQKRVEQVGDELRAAVERKKAAFIRVFKEGAPSLDDRKIVMQELEEFTRGERTPWHVDERVHCVLTGRHEVYNLIKHQITLSLDVLVTEAVVTLNRQTKG